jgi:signal peptidase I
MKDLATRLFRKRNEPKEEEVKVTGFLGWIKELLIVLAVALICSFIIKTFIFKMFFIPSGSMENTMQVGDRVVANVAGKMVTPLKHGDIVIFSDTQGWLPSDSKEPSPNALESAAAFAGVIPDSSARQLVKRVIGLPGDVVECCGADGRVKINGKPIDESYLKANPSSPDIVPGSFKDFKVTVPEGGLWVMGDNRDYSADSRYHMDTPSHGVVWQKDVIGTVGVIIWPLDRMGIIPSQDGVFKDLH